MKFWMNIVLTLYLYYFPVFCAVFREKDIFGDEIPVKVENLPATTECCCCSMHRLHRFAKENGRKRHGKS